MPIRFVDRINIPSGKRQIIFNKRPIYQNWFYSIPVCSNKISYLHHINPLANFFYKKLRRLKAAVFWLTLMQLPNSGHPIFWLHFLGRLRFLRPGTPTVFIILHLIFQDENSIVALWLQSKLQPNRLNAETWRC